MISLTTEEQEFLIKQHIPAEKVINAAGMTRSQRESYARQFGYSVVWVTSPCKKAGHHLKTRSGHCPMCDPDQLKFMWEKASKEILTVAHAPSIGRFWIACLKEMDVEFLNELAYGGARDWQVWKKHSGKSLHDLEWRLMKELNDYTSPHPLEVEGGCLDGSDLLNCSEKQMQQVWGDVLGVQSPFQSRSSSSQNKPSLKSVPQSASPKSTQQVSPPLPKPYPSSIRCPHCKTSYRVPWGEKSKDYRCRNKDCQRWFRTVLRTQPYQHSALYLDIETTGLKPSEHEVTTIVWWSPEAGWGHWINGETDNLVFKRVWLNSKRIVTYNGKNFDEKFIMEHFNLQKHRDHRDLRYVAAEKGQKGGLKKICERLGFRSPEYLNETDGLEAIRLWKGYQGSHDNIALKQLLHYNAWDVVMTYRLDQYLIGNKNPLSVEDSMPFPWEV